MKIKTVITCCLLGGAICLGQDAPQRPPREGRPGPGGPGGPGPRFVMPLMHALDPNMDGIIDEKEIANAALALKKLDKNGDGKLNPEELRPARPDGRSRAGGPPRDGEGRPQPRPPVDK